MTGIKIVDAIAPDLPEGKVVRTTTNQERWFKIINGELNIPTENTLRGNFTMIGTLIEALKNFREWTPHRGIWDDSKVNGITYETPTECINALHMLQQYDRLAVDIESRGVGYSGNKVLLVGFAYSDYDAVVIKNFAPEVVATMGELFKREDITFVWQNGKFDTAHLKFLLGIEARVDEDTMLQHYAGINEHKGTHGLKDLGALYLQTPQWDDVLTDYKKRWCLQHGVKLADFTYDMIPPEILIPYLYRDACATFQLSNLFPKLMRKGSEGVYRMLIKASNVFKDIEYNGCLVDVEYIYRLQDELDDLILEAEKHVKETSDQLWDPVLYMAETGAKTYSKVFNLKSPKQLKWMLERATGMHLLKTDKDTLDQLVEDFPEIPFIQAISDLRKYNKYMDTYVQGILEVMDADNRVRCTFNLHGTETGRLSCSSPNMQNIPRSKMIKNIFVAPEGYELVQFDYSQAELRTLAWLSQDEYLRETYREGKDLHDAMASKIFGPDFTKEQRVAAKTVNFGA